VTAEQFPLLFAQLGVDINRDRRTIGYWFWELSTPSPQARRAAFQVDEVWTASRFVQDAFAGAIDRPVRLVPLPRPEPEPSARTRAEFGLEEGRFTFLCSFDLFSVVERKNPLGVIDAFCKAFPPDEGPKLVIKTINGNTRWVGLERIREAIGDRADIRLWDEHLSRDDHLALIRQVDCLVSLHRSEGLGLHLLEAMALGTVVMATDYSGPTDFVDESCAALIPFRLVPVANGEGAYPEEGSWAEPDLDVAASAMRRLAHEPAHVASLVAAARARIGTLPDRGAVGMAARSLLRHPARRSSP